MNILVTGASGFVGTYLCKALIKQKHNVVGIGTSKKHPLENYDQFEWVSADTTIQGEWQNRVRTSNIIINLTGKNIFGYWTKKYKDQIYKSRIFTTENIVAAIPETESQDLLAGKQPVLLNTSAIGYYGDCREKILTEADQAGNDFLAKVCVDWEKAALKAKDKGARVVIMRFGVVLGKGGGAVAKMLPAFRMFAGGPLGKGVHWFPWIHIDDLVNAIVMIMENDSISGPVNFVAPGNIRHREFAAALGYALKRPSFMPAPGFMIKAVMGELGETLLSSQKAIPDVLNQSGFLFKYRDIKSALEDIV